MIERMQAAGEHPRTWEVVVHGVGHIGKVTETRESLARCAALAPTWVQTCLFAWDGEAPGDAQIEAYLACLEAAGMASLAGVLLYGVARPSMQPEAPRVTALSPQRLDAIAQRIKEKGLTVRVSP